MNGPIRKVTVVVMAMFLAMIVNLSYSYVFRTPSLNDDPNNRRVRDAAFGTDRGDILAGNTVIATSKPSKDTYKFQRSYPAGTLYAAVTGYHSFVYGGAGLERAYTQQLSGTSDSQFLQRLVDLATGTKAKGATIQTTLDPRAQKAASDGLNGRPGAVVALDWSTGSIKALVSTPTFDPNALATHDIAASQEAWKKLQADEGRPMANRAVREIYPPGSTFKVIVAAAALDSGLTPTDMVDAPSVLKLPGTTATINNAGSCGGDKITLQQALVTSCNTAFGNLGMTLGADKVRAQAEKFGFGTTLLPELNGVASRFPANPDKPQTAMSSIGEFEVAATPLQMAMVAGAVANDGVVMDPHLVSQVRAQDLSILEDVRPRALRTAMTPANARALQEMMVAVVDGGTGRRAAIDGVRIGGKTGTAHSDRKRAPYAWFIAWADNPKVAVAVFVQDAGVDGSDVSGGRYAAPIARSVIESLR